MRHRSQLRFSRPIQLLTAALLMALPLPAFGHEADGTIPDPGFRPDSAYTPAFLAALDNTSIAVHPTIVRREGRTAHSFASQDQIIAALGEKKMASLVPGRLRIDLGRLPQVSQWQTFQNSMARIAEKLRDRQTVAEYHLFIELLFPVDHTVFGIHCYVLDRNGENAFSFLLNSHHRIFADARLTANGKSQSARNELTERATRVGISALTAQVEQARERAALAPIAGNREIQAGIFDDFETGLPSGTDRLGIPVGFVTFTDGGSDLKLSTTSDYPPRPDDPSGNKVLRLDFDVEVWAAFAHIFQNDSANAWIAYDWSAFDEFSFWLYGNNSGASLYVDILDNRNTLSAGDDAERFVHNFKDDVAGWRKVTVRFANMHRKEIGNGAPNDGLGLSRVHGWAFGTVGTSGGATYFIDDFELRTTPGAGGTFFHETPIDESSSIMSFVEGDVGQGSTMDRSMSLMCECADVTLGKGYTYFRTEDPREKGDTRMRFKIIFYHDPPQGLPVLSASENLEYDVAPGTFVLDAEEWTPYCAVWKIAQADRAAANMPDTLSAAPGMRPAFKERLCKDAAKVEYPINELPMYGRAQKTPDQKWADQKYIGTVTRGGASREDAAEYAARLGWNYYYSANCTSAIRRFNQAWLLNPDNRNALWGFAVISLERGEIEEATHYFEMAIDVGPEDPSLQQDYDTALSMLD